MSEQTSVWEGHLNDEDRARLNAATDAAPQSNPDLLVIGSDLCALSVAYFAAERGLRVTVLADRPQLGDAPGSSLGCIAPQVTIWQASAAIQLLAQAGRDGWARLAVRPEFDLEWRVCGALVTDSARLSPGVPEVAAWALNEGYTVQAVDAEQIRLLEPALSPIPGGGLYFPSEALLNPIKGACGFVKALQARGAQIIYAQVKDLQITAGLVTAVDTTSGLVSPRRIIAGTSQLDEPLTRKLGMPPSPSVLTQRSCLITDPQPRLLQRMIFDVGWLTQLKTGEILVEATRDGSGKLESESVTIARARRLLPDLADATFQEAWLRQSPGDMPEHPIAMRSPLASNLWLSAGFEYDAVLFAPALGQQFASWIVTDKVPELLQHFSAPAA